MMEYSVNDLVLILLKKWYIILATMLLVGAISAVTSQMSYNNALKQYEAYTQETVPPSSYGSAVATYGVSYGATDNARYFDKELFLQGYISAYADMNNTDKVGEDVNIQAENAFAGLIPDVSLIEADFMNLIADESVWVGTQTAIDALVAQGWGGTVPAIVKDQMSVTAQDGQLCFEVRDMKDDLAKTAVSAFVDQLEIIGMDKYQLAVTTTEKSYDYTPIEQDLTQRAQLSQTVMSHPGSAPNLVKVIGTAAAFSFVFSCFGVLLYTFVKETKSRIIE